MQIILNNNLISTHIAFIRPQPTTILFFTIISNKISDSSYSEGK